MKKYNHLALKNYAYLALFESKYAVYYNERMAASLENVLEVFQYIFLRNITEEEYSKYLYEIVQMGTYVLKKSAECQNKKIHEVKDIQLIQNFLSSSKKSHINKDYHISIPQFEHLLVLINDAVSDTEQYKSYKVVTENGVAVSMKSFAKEYDMLFHCITKNEEVYTLIETVEKEKFPEDKTSSVLSRDTAIHEIHQGFTHLSRHVNHTLSNMREIDRFKSHIKRSALDLLKLSIESIRNFFQKTKQQDLYNQISIELSMIKNQEVSEVVSTAMPDFKHRYTSLIKKFKEYIK